MEKHMKKMLVTSLVFLVTGCANVLQTGSISEAYENYADKNYEETLKLITQAGSINTTGPELRAELTYLKAQTYDKLGLHETARNLYEYLRDQHDDSQYGYLAATWLEKNK